MQILTILTSDFNIAATMTFIDPFRAANYLAGSVNYKWRFASLAKTCRASNGVTLETRLLDELSREKFDLVVVSSSWLPEVAATPAMLAALRRWARNGSIMAALDTGAFILAGAGLLKGRRATVHYEHIDALKELHSDIEVTEELFVEDDKRFTCCGGLASSDMALHIIASASGHNIANAVARYIFHPKLRPFGSSQNPALMEPLGHTVPDSLKQAIALMELHLEHVLPITTICDRLGKSQRQIDRLFRRYVGKSPVLYYRDIRLDRARGLVTQTEMAISQIALASGFSSPVHFTRAYREHFGIAPRDDRVEGRIPFDFRPWPMHSPRVG